MTRHPAGSPIEQLLVDCEIKKTRGSGPGGQHRNKVESAIVITHSPTQIVGQASERRSQHENRAVAIERLRQNLALGIRLAIEPNQIPSDLWSSRLKGQQISISVQHPDFPALLAECLDFVAATEFDIGTAAIRLRVTGSQLVKLLKSFPPAFQWVNRSREERGLGRLK